MNEMDGVVVRIEGAHAWVRAAGPGPACGACAQGCATGGRDSLLAAAAAGKPELLRLPNAIRARPGDAVVIRAADGLVLKAVWRAYGLPLALALAGALLAGALTGSDGFAGAGLVLGLLAGFGLLRRRGLDASRTEPILSMVFKRPSTLSVKDRETC